MRNLIIDINGKKEHNRFSFALYPCTNFFSVIMRWYVTCLLISTPMASMFDIMRHWVRYISLEFLRDRCNVCLAYFLDHIHPCCSLRCNAHLSKLSLLLLAFARVFASLESFLAFSRPSIS